MKKNKLVGLSVAAITTVVLLSGVTYAWFVDQAITTPVDVSTGTIKIEGIALNVASNKLPGDKILMNNNGTKITQKGTREAIVEVSFDDQLAVKLADGKTPTTAFINDYEANGTFKSNRVNQVGSITMETIPTSSQFVEVDGKFYASLPQAANSTITLGNIYLNIDGELGGNKGPAPLSPDRGFEMGSIFSVKYSAIAVQTTKAAVVDVFGQDVADALVSAGMLTN